MLGEPNPRVYRRVFHPSPNQEEVGTVTSQQATLEQSDPGWDGVRRSRTIQESYSR